MTVRGWAGAAACAAILASGRTADANPASDALRAQASAHIYNLEHAEAMAAFKQAVAADPSDAAAYRGLATT
jgi:Flp pilus assembly protein TadD